MVFEVLGFADVSKICSKLPYQHLKALTQFFDHAPEVLVSWLRTLTVTRNVCAHHARLWDRTYSILPKRSKEIPNQISYKSTAEQLSIIHYLLDKIDGASSWLEDIAIILQDIEVLAGLKRMGFRNSNTSTDNYYKVV
ncbi:MAG: Abi family protein [Proteobacteria bacterium]|nr:Abi family protein [Pseudomonadota bacterium]